MSALPHEHCVALPISFWPAYPSLQEKQRYIVSHYLAPTRIPTRWRQMCAIDWWASGFLHYMTFRLEFNSVGCTEFEDRSTPSGYAWQNTFAQNSQVSLTWITRCISDVWKLRQYFYLLRSKMTIVHDAHNKAVAGTTVKLQGQSVYSTSPSPGKQKH